MNKNRIRMAAVLCSLLACSVLGVSSAHAEYRLDKLEILQSKADGIIPGEYYLGSKVEEISWGRLPNRNTKPIITIPSGATITIDAVSHEGILEDQGLDPIKYFGKYGVPAEQVLADALAIAKNKKGHNFDKDGPHIVTGPIAIEGAEPGDVLKVEVLSLVPRVPYGVITNRHYKGCLVGEFPEGLKRLPDASPLEPDKYGNVSIFTPIKKIDGYWYGYFANNGREIKFPISPFLGIMGVAPNTDESWSSVPPARIGGNIDINEMGVGSTLYLPIEVKGANFFTGDPHFVQGDGEVALTALEGSLRGTLRLTVLKKGSAEIPATNSTSLVAPFGETEKYWIPVGLNEDLDEAMKQAVRESISFVSKQLGIERRLVYAYLSAAVDYEVSQVVDKTKGIHGLIPKADFISMLNLKLSAGDKTLPVSLFNNSFYIPAKPIITALGIDSKLTNKKSTVTVNGKAISFAVDSNKYVCGDEAIYKPYSPVLINGELMLPVAVLSDVFGVSVNWSTASNSIIGKAVLLK